MNRRERRRYERELRALAHTNMTLSQLFRRLSK
jgi:hypothetical protein